MYNTVLSIFRSVHEEFSTIRADVSRIHPDQATLSECQTVWNQIRTNILSPDQSPKLFAEVFSWHIHVLCILGNFLCYFCHLLTFTKSTFSKISFRNIIRVSNRLYWDQDLISIQPVYKGYQMIKVAPNKKIVKSMTKYENVLQSFSWSLLSHDVAHSVEEGHSVMPWKFIRCLFKLNLGL